jgi:hypothetical protein
MDLREFFKRMREIEATIAEPDALVVSYETGDGGKPGVVTETPRGIAARLIVEGRARLATPIEAEAHQEMVRLAIEQAERAALADRVQVALVSDADLEGLKQRTKSKKG